MRKIITITILLQVTLYSFCQSPKEQLEIINSAEITGKEYYEEITYENKFGLLTIPVKIGKQTYDYIFDTGGYNTLTSEIMSDNGLPELMEVEVGSANRIKSKIKMTKVPLLQIGNVNVEDVGALNFDFDESPSIKCYTNGGLIGKSVIRNGVWQINSQEQKIIVTNDIKRLSYLDNAVKVKVKLDKLYNPFIKAKINGKTYSFLLDFGFEGLLSLTQKNGEKLKSNTVVEITGEGSEGANGIIEETTYIKPIDELRIAGQKLSNKFAYYYKSHSDNLIGSEIIKFFIITLNFREKELYLTPITNKFEDEENGLNSFGFALNKNDENIYVSKIYTNGTAQKSGLKFKDIIQSINGRDFANTAYCEFYEYFREILDRDEDIVLNVMRNNSVKIVRIEKMKLF